MTLRTVLAALLLLLLPVGAASGFDDSCQDACLAACPTQRGAMGSMERDRACVARCLTMSCGETPARQPQVPPIPDAGEAPRIVLEGIPSRMAATRGAFTITAAGTPRGGTFTWEAETPVPLTFDPAQAGEGLFPMPDGPRQAATAKRRAAPMAFGRTRIRVHYQVGGRTATAEHTIVIEPPVLFLHGVASDSGAWKAMGDHLAAKEGWRFGGKLCERCGPPQPGDFYTADFSRPQDSYRHQGAEVAGHVAAITALLPPGAKAEARRVVLMAHSMGGLASRSYLQDPLYATRRDVAALVTVGTPHRGSLVALLLNTAGHLHGIPPIEELERALPAGPPGSYWPLFTRTYTDYVQPLARELGAPVMIRLVKFGLEKAGIPLDPRMEATRELGIVSEDMKRLNGDAARQLPRDLRYVSVIGTLPPALAEEITQSAATRALASVKAGDPVLQHYLHVIGKTDGLVDQGSQSLNSVVPGIAAEIHIQAIHCCWSDAAPDGGSYNETEQPEPLRQALRTTGLFGSLGK